MACVKKRRGKWAVDYRDGGGTRRWITCRTRRDADRKLAQINGQQALVPAVDPNVKVAEYSKRYLERVSESRKFRTVESYEQSFRLYILPEFGNRKVVSMDRGRIKSFLARKLAGGLSRNTVRIIHATLRGMLTDAIDDGIIAANPASRLGKSLSLVTPAKQRQEEIKAMDRQQLSAFLKAALTKMSWSIYALFLLLARTGLRWGEAIALQWEDLNFQSRGIRVERAFSGGRIETPKNGCGRDVDMSGQLCRTLQELRARRREEWFRAGKGELPSESLVFLSEAGTMLDYANTLKLFKKCLKVANLPGRFTPHCMRHSYASILLQDGASPAYVQSQLGHASIQLTVDTYGKWLPKKNKAAVDALDDDGGNAKTALEEVVGLSKSQSAENTASDAGFPASGSKMVAISQNGELFDEGESPQVVDSIVGEP